MTQKKKTIQGFLQEGADESKEEAKISSEDHHWENHTGAPSITVC